MRKQIVLAIALVLMVVMLSGCVSVTLGPSWSHGQGSSVRGTGEIISFPVETDSFSSVRVTGHYEIIYRQAQANAVRFEIHENLIELLDVRVESGSLIISSDAFFTDNSTPRVYIYAPRLDEISIAGASRLRDWDTVTTENLSLSVVGATSGDLPLDVRQLDVVVPGAVSIRLTGSADAASISMFGAGDISAGELQTQSASVNISGAGRAVIAVANTLDVSISGAGSVRYIGDPVVTQSISGAGSVRRGS